MRTALARWRAREPQDAGITMIEMVVTMAIMSVLMVLFTTAVAQMYRTYNKVDATNQAQEQVNNVFLRLDKEIRYANAVSDPLNGVTVSAVEYQLNVANVSTCVQLRLRTDTGLLQRRSWAFDGGTPPASWTTLITGVQRTPSGAGTVPAFTRLAPTDAQNYQRLRLNFTTTAGGAAASTARLTDITFTALNTSKSTQITNLCSDGRNGL